jgi:hypothetical protein
MRRVLEPIDSSRTIVIVPIVAPDGTCVPPHSSLEKSPIVTTRTTWPYLSPKLATAPAALASSIDMISVCTCGSRRTRSLIAVSISWTRSSDSDSKWGKSKRSRPGCTSDPACWA